MLYILEGKTCQEVIKQRRRNDVSLNARKNPLQCNVCQKKFSSKMCLQRHKKTHTGERNHVCINCGKSFARTDVLKRHMLTHSDNSPYEFPICTNKKCCFKTKDHLCTHVKRHDEAKYSCNVCQQIYSSEKYLQRHKKTHTGEKKHVCTTCGRSFTRKDALNSHMLTHSDERPNECPICPDKQSCFKTKDHLHRHMKRHEEAKYSCDICKLKFFTPKILKSHKQSHFGDNKQTNIDGKLI